MARSVGSATPKKGQGRPPKARHTLAGPQDTGPQNPRPRATRGSGGFTLGRMVATSAYGTLTLRLLRPGIWFEPRHGSPELGKRGGVHVGFVGGLCVEVHTAKLERPPSNAASLRGLCVLCAQVKRGQECRLRRSHQQGTHVGVSGPCALSRVPPNGAFELRGTTAGSQAREMSPAEVGGPQKGQEQPKEGAPWKEHVSAEGTEF